MPYSIAGVYFSPVCWRYRGNEYGTSYTSNPLDASDMKLGTYRTDRRTVCNVYAAEAAIGVLKGEGWRLPKETGEDDFNLTEIVRAAHNYRINIVDPFCSGSVGGGVPLCTAVQEACKGNPGWGNDRCASYVFPLGNRYGYGYFMPDMVRIKDPKLGEPWAVYILK